MKTRLLKKLRIKAKKNVRIFRTQDYTFPYSIFHLNKENRIISKTNKRTLDEVKSILIEERRSYIMKIIKIMRIERENKQLRKL
jgi:hypothetical protein